MNRFQSYKGTGSPAAHAPPSKGSALAIGKEGGSASQLPIRRRTPEKVEDYRRKNLCFKCDEPYTMGHKCKNNSLMLIESEALGD